MDLKKIPKRIKHLLKGHSYDISTYTYEDTVDRVFWSSPHRVGDHVEETFWYTVVKMQKKECECGKVIEEEIDSWAKSNSLVHSFEFARRNFNDAVLDRLGIDKKGPSISVVGCGTVPANERAHFTDDEEKKIEYMEDELDNLEEERD